MNPFAYATVILIWGTTPLGVQWSGQGVSPFAGALFRMLIALVILAMIMRALNIPLLLDAHARRIYRAAVPGQGVAMLMVYWSSSYLPSSLISLIFGFSPLITGMLGWYLYRERMTVTQSAAVVLGVFGLLVTISANLFQRVGEFDIHYIEALLLMSVACLLFSLSNIWIKRFSENVDLHPLSMTTGSLLFAMPLYLFCVLLDGFSFRDIEVDTRTTASILYLAVFGSVLAPYCFFIVLKKTSANMVALITVVAPVIALFLAAFLNDEALGARMIVGAALVIASLLIFQFGAYEARRE